MAEGPDIAAIAALIGDPARATMLNALMGGLALSAGELAREAGVSPQTASAHLAQMTAAGLLLVAVQGRHRYFRIAGPDVAEGLEALMGMAGRLGNLRSRPGPRDPALRFARMCYDHLAGDIATAAFDAMLRRHDLVLAETGLALTPSGEQRFRAEGLLDEDRKGSRRPVCRACLDWSTRRDHLAGILGRALADHTLRKGWARRVTAGREVIFSPSGLASFRAFTGIEATVASAVLAPDVENNPVRQRQKI